MVYKCVPIRILEFDRKIKVNHHIWDEARYVVWHGHNLVKHFLQVAILGSGNWGCLSAALFPSKMDGWHSLDDISWHSFGSFGSFWRSSQVQLPRSSPAIANVGQTSRSVWKCGSTRKKWTAVSSPRSLTAIMRMWSIFQGWRCLRTCCLTNLIHKLTFTLTFTLTHLHWFKAFKVREFWPNKIAPAG